MENRCWIAIFLTVMIVSIEAYPSWIRQKRVSDQRLAELETLLALNRLKGRLPSAPVGFGFIDPAKIGRKKRFAETDSDHILLNNNPDPSSAEVEQTEYDFQINDIMARSRNPLLRSYDEHTWSRDPTMNG